MLRINTVGAGAVEYLLRGSGCAAHRGPEQGAEQGTDGPGYYAAAVEHGEPECGSPEIVEGSYAASRVRAAFS